jgi:hypothetical protein
VIRTTLAILLSACGLAGVTAQAAELIDIKVERDGARYKLESNIRFKVDQQSLFAVIINYDRFEEMSSIFIDTYNMEPGPDGKPRFYTLMEGCVVIFCKQFERFGHLETTPYDEVIAKIDPETSDFRYSWERWQFKTEPEGTVLMRYQFEMEPGFWVPPIIGPYVIRRTLREGGIDAVDRIERIAQEVAAAGE